MIPGITNSGIDTQSLIDQIMDAQRAPVERMERQIDRYEDERAAWRELGRKISNLQAASRLLFSFETPFLERVASSSDPSSLTATANRNAQLGVASVDVRQLAAADRFISRNLATDFQVPAGRYGFRVGEQETFFTFQGGQLRSFAQTINQRAGDIVSAR
ncbi:MAG: flagellar hook-associated protein, partial [Spirochaetaceae bacterium]